MSVEGRIERRNKKIQTLKQKDIHIPQRCVKTYILHDYTRKKDQISLPIISSDPITPSLITYPPLKAGTSVRTVRSTLSKPEFHHLYIQIKKTKLKKVKKMPKQNRQQTTNKTKGKRKKENRPKNATRDIRRWYYGRSDPLKDKQ